MSSVNRLLVVTHVTHYRHDGAVHAYGPYVREMNVWCDLFPQVVIAAPLADGPPPGDGLAFSSQNMQMHPIPKSGGDTALAKLKQLVLLPWIVTRLCFAMWKADAIHVRCPGNLGLLGVVLGPIFSSKLVAKYAGQWSEFPGEARSVRLQRRLLGSRWWRGIVTVYGDWPNQPKHVVPFFTSVMTKSQMDRARAMTTRRLTCPSSANEDPLTVVFVGRLSREKNVDTLIEAVARLTQQGIDIRCHVVGQGAEFESLCRLAEQWNVRDQVQFAGGVDYDRVFDFYEQSDVLVLVSETEGWPKAIAEAMACGLVCIGSERGLVPWMLAEGRGFTAAPRDVETLTEFLKQLSESVELRQSISKRAAEFGCRYSLDSLRTALAELLSERWSVELAGAATPQNHQAKASESKDSAANQSVVVP